MTVSRSILPLSLCLLLASISGFAQTTTSTLEGTVRDASGGVLPEVSVRVTGPTVDRTVVTDAAGFYRAVELSSGAYQVVASKAGFATKTLTGINLVLDRTVTLDITLTLAAVAESVTVTAAVPLLDPANPSLRQVVDARTIDSIPLNGRNYLDLVRLSPGVAVNTIARRDLTSRDTNGAILGDRAANAAFLIDGLANNDDFHGGVLQAFTQDAIQEFEVIESNYKAEFGRGSGGVVNVVTKSGSNALHGSGFLFFRNDALDSSNVPGQDPPALTRYNYGFTLGGPIRKDKNWFFGSLEHVAENRAALFPPNIPDLLKAQENFSRQPETHDTRAFGKYNLHLNGRNDLRVELSYSRPELLNELATAISLPSNSTNNLTRTFLGTVAVTSILNPRLVLDSSFSVRDQSFDQNLKGTIGQSYSALFVDDGTSFNFGPPIGSVQELGQRYYTGRETLGWFSGAHSAKFGAEFIRTQADGRNGQGLQNVIVTVRPFFQQFGLQSFQLPQGVGFLNPGDDLTRLRNNGLSLFAQDDWKLRSSLTLNVGVRYDYDSKFGTNNVAPRLGLSWSPDRKTVFRGSWGLFYDRYRLGIVQAVPEFGGFNGRTQVEIDYPRLAADVLLNLAGSLRPFVVATRDPNFINKQFNIPNGALVTVNNIQSLTGLTPAQFLAALTQFLAGFNLRFNPLDFSPFTGFLRQNLSAGFQDQIRAARPFHTPYNHTLTLGLQRQLGSEVVLSANWVHRSIRDILGVRIANLAFQSRTVGAPITTDGGPLQRTYGPWYKGEYNAVILALDKRFGHRFQVQANYTYADGNDNLLNSNLGLGIATQGGGAVPTDNLNLEFDRGNSDLLVAHGLVTSGVWTLPAGFWVSGVFRATSGFYFSAAGPLIDYDGDGISSRRPRDTFRNQFRGPASANLDLRFEKRFTFAERFTASALVEFFNLTNARNPALIDNSFVSGAPGPTFGTVRVPLPGRETQFGFRFQF